jgi:hypothetical protein
LRRCVAAKAYVNFGGGGGCRVAHTDCPRAQKSVILPPLARAAFENTSPKESSPPMTLSQKIYRAVSWFALVIFPLFVLFFARAYISDPSVYRNYLYEDHLVEWLTAIFLFLASIISFVIAARIRKKDGYLHWFFIAFGLLCLTLALEEISWGQRIFGWKTPRFLGRYSAKSAGKAETNLHNVLRGITGIRTRYIYSAVALLYGILLPILYTWNARVKSYLDRRRFVVPSVWLTPGFLISIVPALIRIVTKDDEEVSEMFSGLAFFLISVMEFIKLYFPGKTPAPQAGPDG